MASFRPFCQDETKSHRKHPWRDWYTVGAELTGTALRELVVMLGDGGFPHAPSVFAATLGFWRGLRVGVPQRPLLKRY